MITTHYIIQRSDWDGLITIWAEDSGLIFINSGPSRLSTIGVPSKDIPDVIRALTSVQSALATLAGEQEEQHE